MNMPGSKILYRLALAALLACSSAAQAATAYDFGTLLTASKGYPAPNNFAFQPFAHLDAVNNGNAWTFTLTVNNNLFSSFGNNAYIGSISFDFTPDPVKQPVSSFVSSNVGGVQSVASTNGGDPSGLNDIDFGTSFGKNSKDRLSQNDFVTWNVTGLAGTSYTNMYIKVMGINDGYYAKYTPETVTAAQLSALTSEAEHKKTEADYRKDEADRARVDAEAASAAKAKADDDAAAAAKAKADAEAAAAEQAKIAALAAAAEQAKIEAEHARVEEENKKALALAAEDEHKKAEEQAAAAEQARYEAECIRISEEDFRHRALLRDEQENHSGSGSDGGSCSSPPHVSPVPEPETYAMLLAGLGLLGFTARRRKQNV